MSVGISAAPLPATAGALRLVRAATIERVAPSDWDPYLGSFGSFTWEGLRFLEAAFQRGGPGNDWRFHYYRIFDERGRLLLATFFTDALWKLDLLASDAASREIERRREDDPALFTRRVFSMGSLLTEGQHLYLAPELRPGGRRWREVLSLLLDAVDSDAAEAGLDAAALRDLPAQDAHWDDLLSARGFAKMPMPESGTVEISWRDEAEFLECLPSRTRRHHRRQVLPFCERYERRILGAATRRPSAREAAHFYRLYLDVKRRSYALNTFDLPPDLFARMGDFASWEILSLYPRRPDEGSDATAAAMVAAFLGPEQYAPIVMGLDRRFAGRAGLYRQCLRHSILRAGELGYRRVLLGMGAGLEKRRFGARLENRALYVKTDDWSDLAAIGVLEAQLAGNATTQEPASLAGAG